PGRDRRFGHADRRKRAGWTRPEPTDPEAEGATAGGIPAVGGDEPDSFGGQSGRVDGELVDAGMRLVPPRCVDGEPMVEPHVQASGDASEGRSRSVAEDAGRQADLREARHGVGGTGYERQVP